MQIIGTEVPEKDKKNKKLIRIILIIVAMLFVISIALICYIAYLSSTQFKFTVDGKSTDATDNLFIFEDNTVYISIKDFSKILGYKAYNGGYKQYSEDTTKCYIENANEVASFELGSNKIYKTPPEKQDEYEYFTIQEPVKLIGDELYITPEGMSIACNTQIVYSKEKNSITVYSLDYLARTYIAAYKTNNGIKDNFKNQKALLYNMIVLSNAEKGGSSSNLRYGVYTLTGEEIIGAKYNKIEFVESTQEFIVTTSDRKVGIITATGETKVTPQYDELKQIDKDLNLYLATNGGKKGVIEKNGKILIYLEYDEIGADTSSFTRNDIKNKYLLFDNCIPVKQNNKWGMYDKRGNLIVPIEYDSLGCIAGTSRNKTANNVLIIPDVEGIVVCKELQINNSKKKYYGIFNSQGKELVPIALETIYSVTSSGREEYTMVNAGISYDVIDWIRRNISSQDPDNINNEQTNTETNEV